MRETKETLNNDPSTKSLQIITALFEEYSITSPDDSNIEKIAFGESLIIEESDLSECLGKINFTKSGGLITVDIKIKGRGQKRFTIAHEMGHFFNEHHLIERKKYSCLNSDFFPNAIKKRENDANEFAAEFLMYSKWFLEYVRGKKLEIKMLKGTAEYFNVSLSATAIRYSKIGKYPIAVILSKNGAVIWSSINEYFPYKFVPKGYKVRETAGAYDYFKGKEMQSGIDLVPVLAWFGSDFHGKSNKYLNEENYGMKNYNSVLTVLWKD